MSFDTPSAPTTVLIPDSLAIPAILRFRSPAGRARGSSRRCSTMPAWPTCIPRTTCAPGRPASRRL